MNWDEEIDLLAGKKTSTKHGRRASNPSSPGSPDEVRMGSGTGTPPDIPVRTRKTGGWADEGSKSAKSRGSNAIEQERFQKQKSTESEDEIPIIPDIDDIQDDPLNLPDVKIPNVTVKKSTYRELDSQLDSGKSSFRNLDDIDLSILTSKLYPEKEVQRCTEVWTMEALYQEISKST